MQRQEAVNYFPPPPELPDQPGKITVLFDPSMRANYLRSLIYADGLGDVVEYPDRAYCPIALTQAPRELKAVLAHRQEVLIEVLRRAGITGYDPKSAPYSPDRNLFSQPNEVYAVDSGKILGARFFTGHNLLPSSGYGVESQKAIQFLRIPVILFDRNIRASRMQPHRTIYLEYENFDRQADEFVEVFEFLKQYEPGVGFNGRVPVLLGFRSEGGNILDTPIDLEEATYERFPHLWYEYKGERSTVNLDVENPEIFYELPPPEYQI